MIHSEQQDYVTRMFKLFKEGDLLNYNIPPNHSFRPLSAVAPEAQAACTQIFSTVVSALRKDVALPVDSIETFLDEIIGEALKSMNQAQVTSLSRVVASVANKWNEGSMNSAHQEFYDIEIDLLFHGHR